MTSADVVAEVEAVRQTVAGWFDIDRSGWTAKDRSAVLMATLDLQERVSALVIDTMADWDRDGAWSVDGALTPAAWLRSHAVPAVEARRKVRSAGLVQRSDEVAKALKTGDI